MRWTASQPGPSILEFTFDFDVDEAVSPTFNAYVNIPEAYKEMATERFSQKARKLSRESPRLPPLDQWTEGSA